MLRHSVTLLTVLVSSSSAIRARTSLASTADDALIGRWDITIQTPGGERPSWLELEPSGRGIIVGRFVGIVGSARPISRVTVQSDSFHFAIPPQWENGEADLVVDGRLTGGHLAGSDDLPGRQAIRVVGRSRAGDAWRTRANVGHADPSHSCERPRRLARRGRTEQSVGRR